ncbi:MAG TPA: DNA polymerase III subunit delta' [Vicinamibacteria bacterium]|nr:DNA polymerase III subunit delta' [Vicinamibacteria bacterium]
MAFAEVLGHDRAKAVLAAALRQRRLPHALLLAGPEGVGKKRLAIEAARALLCEADGEDACGRCATCSRIARGIHPDAFLVQPETPTIRIEQVRDVVREVAGRPFEARARAFIIDEAHLMTDQAANALLKGLEEPPPTSHLLLVTHSPQALLSTIRSRCQLLRLTALPSRLLEDELQRRWGFSADEARLRAAFSAGSVGRALAFDPAAYRTLRQELLAILEAAGRAGAIQWLEAGERLGEVDDPVFALTALRSLLRDVVALRSGTPAAALLNTDLAARLDPLARSRLGERAVALAEAVGRTRDALEGKTPDPPFKQGPANRQIAMDALMDVVAAAAS